MNYNGTTYYRLQMPCPVCIQKGRKSSVAYWKHYEDGGDIYIGSDGFLLCAKCGRRSHIRYWKYRCPEHSYGQIQRLTRYIHNFLIKSLNNSNETIQYYSLSLENGERINSEDMLNAMSLSLPLIRQLSKAWLCKFIQNI